MRMVDLKAGFVAGFMAAIWIVFLLVMVEHAFAEEIQFPQGTLLLGDNPQLVMDDDSVYPILRFGPECDFVYDSDHYTVVWGTIADDAGNQGAVLASPDGQRCGVLVGVAE